MSVTESEPVTVGITVPSIAPQDLLERVTAMADDLAAAGISVELDVIRTPAPSDGTGRSGMT
ncbi:MAG: hypothetical protein JST33_16430 [Actinobacteria bacterium]|nr:hypothetical protein [Actinomycetota bacterium]